MQNGDKQNKTVINSVRPCSKKLARIPVLVASLTAISRGSYLGLNAIVKAQSIMWPGKRRMMADVKQISRKQ